MNYQETAVRLLALPDQERAEFAARYAKLFSTRDGVRKEIESLNEELLRKTEPRP